MAQYCIIYLLMYGTVLYHILINVWHSVVLHVYCSVLYVLYCVVVLDCVVLYGITLYCIVLYCMHCIVCRIILYGGLCSVLYHNIQYCTSYSTYRIVRY